MTERRQRFIIEFLQSGNATQAAIAAGFSKKGADVAGCRLLGNAKVAAEVKRLRSERAEEARISAQWVVERLRENHDRAMQAVPVITFNHDKKQMEETGEYTYQGAVANKALELLGKHLGMFVDRTEHSGSLELKEVKVTRVIIKK